MSLEDDFLGRDFLLHKLFLRRICYLCYKATFTCLGILNVFLPHNSYEPDLTANNLVLPNRDGGPAAILTLQNLTVELNFFSIKKIGHLSHEPSRGLNRKPLKPYNLTYRDKKNSIKANQSEAST